MTPTKLKDNIWWVGVQDPELRTFDVIMSTQWGTSYNSYLIRGSEKIAVVDAVKEAFCEEQLSRIREVCDPKEIDYIICNHTEPDHSGSLKRLMDAAPNAVIVCSRPAKTFIKEITNRDFECIIAGDGVSLDLGDKTIDFISAPYLHWPDSIFTYVKEDAFLSTGDVFGFHFSAKNIFDDLTQLDANMIESQKYYFDVIMAPFKPYALEAIEKIRNLKISIIGPSHGPVLRGDPWGAVKRYEKWAQPTINDPKKIYIGYVSCYGYTAKLAAKVFEGAQQNGVEVEIEDISKLCAGDVAAKIQAADAFALGSPTLNRDALKPVWDVLTSLCPYVMKGKHAAVFGSYGWSGEACKYMTQRLENIGAVVAGESRAKLNPSDEELMNAYDLGVALRGTIQ
ncbi:MAG: FprA family A-type flavoprotein [Christensenellaceae bacterium]